MRIENKFRLKNSGLSLIEVLVAIAIGLIMTAALLSLFDNFNSMNQTQNGLARLQENGRFVVMRMKKDIENVSYQPCSSISLNSPHFITEGFASKAIVNYENVPGLPSPLAGVPRPIDPQYFIQGHECDSSGLCTPATNVFPGGDPFDVVPAVGTTAGTRARQTDVLTMRILASEGVEIESSIGPTMTVPDSAQLAIESGDKLLVADCLSATITSGTVVGPSTVTANVDVNGITSSSGGKIYNFTKDFETVSYYVGFKTNPSDSNKVISSLYRVSNGNAPQEIVEGVERLDLTYGVQFKDSRIGYLTASEIQGASTDLCVTEPVIPSGIVTNPNQAGFVNQAGCLWRSVVSVRVNMLLNTVNDSAKTATETYVYTPDGTTPQTPTTLPSGVDPGYMYRKEFSETIILKSYSL